MLATFTKERSFTREKNPHKQCCHPGGEFHVCEIVLMYKCSPFIDVNIAHTQHERDREGDVSRNAVRFSVKGHFLSSQRIRGATKLQLQLTSPPFMKIQLLL